MLFDIVKKLFVIKQRTINKTIIINKYEGIGIPVILNTNEKITGNKMIKLKK